MYVNFIRDHEYVSDEKTGTRHRYPRGWLGHVDDKRGKKALDAGDAVEMGVEAGPAKK